MSEETLKLIAIVLVIVGIVMLPAVVDSTQCRAKAVKQELQFDYSVMQGCMVKHNGKWIDYDRLRYTEE